MRRPDIDRTSFVEYKPAMEASSILAELVKILGDRWNSWDRAREEASSHSGQR